MEVSDKMKVKLKPILKYTFLFFLFFLFTLICMPINLDEVWNYGFSYNIYQGLLPYKDFNMVLTPFYPFFMSLFLHLFGSGIVTMHFINAIFLCICCYLLFQLFDKKAYLIIFFFFFPYCLVFPNYNMFLIFLTILLIYLEKKEIEAPNKKLDYIIGIVLGCSILTKQTVGICLLLPSIICQRKQKKLQKRVIGLSIPLLIFFLYLLGTNTLKEFIDLCILGLIDFSGNSKGINLFAIISFILIIMNINWIRKEKNIVNYYVLSFTSILIPICDPYHFFAYFAIYLLMIIPRIKKDYINYALLSITSIIILGGMNFYYYTGGKKVTYPNNLHNFEYRLVSYDNLIFTKQVLTFIQKEQKKGNEIVLLNANAYYFKLINQDSIHYIDLINHGNWGYHGSDKLLNKLKNKKNTIYLINQDDFDPRSQIDKKALNYVVKNYQKTQKIGCFDIYEEK